MNITWVLADDTVLDGTVNTNELKEVGSFWGSWRTWRDYATDNVVCNDLSKSRELIQRNFQTTCNLYIPNSNFTILDRPVGVKLYEGELDLDVNRKDELIAMTLAATVSDVILLLGFNWQEQQKNPDKLLEHRAQNYRGIVYKVISENYHVQWVMVDHPSKVRPEIAKLPNFSSDSLKSVLKLLGH
jgi:hypothetical protein